MTIFNKSDKKLLEDYRPVLLHNVDFDNRVFEKFEKICFDHFVEFLTKHQHDADQRRSVTTYMLPLVKQIYEASDRNSKGGKTTL